MNFQNFRRFNDKVVIITGATAGIGQAAAVRFGLEGAAVVIHGRSPQGMKETHQLLTEAGVKEDKILEVFGDVTDDKALKAIVEKTVEKFARIDVLVNNAGTTAESVGLNGAEIESIDFILDGILKSCMKLVHYALPHLEKSKGNVVNVSSVDSELPHPAALNYSISKAALDHYARNTCIGFARKGVRINNVNPGYVHTKIKLRGGATEQQLKEFEEGWCVRNVPVGRPGTVQEIASAIAFLASDEASFITGECLFADGGLRQNSEQQTL
ncbi:3-oxoacyl-acyl-carrier-protein reductase [Aphelenchoides avenae]|nr:3-oxoacyl-acyl-carrier-protein reductase [Aphelenchus avenae]